MTARSSRELAEKMNDLDISQDSIISVLPDREGFTLLYAINSYDGED